MTPENPPGSRGPLNDLLNCLLIVMALVALLVIVWAIWVTVGGSDLGLVR
ncbi:hypothetical protein [Streptomyces fagopyri]